MAIRYWLALAGILVLGYAVIKDLVIPRVKKTKIKWLLIRLSVYMLFVGCGISAVCFVWGADRYLSPYLGVSVGWWIVFILLAVTLIKIIVWFRTSFTLKHIRPLTMRGLRQKDWYIVEIRPDFSKSPKDRIGCTGGSWEDVVRGRPHLSKLSARGPLNHIICLDGTWNDAESNTNVRRIFNLLRDTCENGEAQIARYYTGVGIKENENLSLEVLGEKVTHGLIPCATGSGEKTIRWQAYFDFVATYEPGDRLFIFGFSRGASSARILANFIAQYGIPERIQAKYQRPPKSRGKAIEADKLRFLAVLGDSKKEVPIEVMGLWDTVAAFGLPSNKFEPFRMLTIPSNVRKVYHLVAIDDKRWEFDPTLIRHEFPDTRVEEVWFAGAHTNVGGGYVDKSGKEQTGLSDIALRYMINRALEHKLCIKREWSSELNDDVRGPIWPGYRFWPRIGRRIRVTGTRTDTLPRIHKSVFERMNSGVQYNPPNLKKLENTNARKFVVEERN